jgi:prepilin-type N-terminal cleavage/methylation domain-containing protein
MKFSRNKKIRNIRGFTLIEVVLSVALAGFIAAMLIPFMGKVMRSVNPVVLTQQGAYLNSIMENMSADYTYQMANALANGLSPAAGLSAFISHVETANYYSDEANPYTVLKNQRVSFSGNPPTETPNNGSKILRVTIKYQDLSATALFTE